MYDTKSRSLTFRTKVPVAEAVTSMNVITAELAADSEDQLGL